MSYEIETRCLYGDGISFDKEQTGAISFPIYQTATFAHKGVGRSTGYDYSRLQNPTREHLEQVVASLEGGKAAFAFSSGMAAITAFFENFEPGDHIIADEDLYGGSIRLFDNISKKNGIKITRRNLLTEDIEKDITSSTRAIFFETPTNPMMNVIDIEKYAEIARVHRLLLIVDNTFLSPYFQNPLSLGADVVIHSGTKFLAGHNDTLSGFVVTNNDKIAERMAFILKTVGSGLAPFDSWLVLRGIKTLPLRMERQQKNALLLADWLRKNEKVKKVYYPGFEDSPGHEVMKKQARGFGSMITFEVDSKETAYSILENVRLIHFAESLGGVETLITYPVTQTHADVPEEIRLKNGITDSILRLSVGVENGKDLIAEFERVFA
ncbi:MAG TPA: cystathionine gamma-synthase [Lachnospiraceae bacterium]|nr:cystathionine gamma-synthase [Lachnospiraceae bacterium]